MAFWGVEVKPGKPFTLKANTTTDAKRLHLSQATLGLSSSGTNRSVIQCNVGNKSPLLLCVLSPEKLDSCQLNIEFQESEDVIFSVIGPRSVHLTGYFLGRSSSTGLMLNDESESFGEDIVDTDVEKGSSDDYDYSDSFINDDADHPSSTDDDELTVKERVARTKATKSKKRLRKTFQVSDSDSDGTSVRAGDSVNDDSVEILDSDEDHKTPNVLSSEVPPASRVTRSKAKSSTLENGEKTSEAATTHSHKAKDKKEDKPSGDVDELSPVKKDSDGLSKKKKKKRNKEPVVINTDEEKEKDNTETLKKPETDKAIVSSADATLSKKKRKKEKREEEATGRKKQAIEKNMKKEAKKPELSLNEVTVEEIEKGKSDGKVAVQGKKVSILYTAKLKDTGKVFESNLEESPLKFRLGGDKVIKGLSKGLEGMRVGDKRRLIIPPSLGYSEEGLKNEHVPKNSWLVYEVEAVKVR